MIFSDLATKYPELDGIFTELPSYVNQNCVIREFSPESFILRKGEILDNVYLLLDGTVNVINEFEEGERFNFAQVTSVNLLGEIELLAHEPIIAVTCVAATKCNTLQIPLGIIERWIIDDLHFFRFITTALATKNYKTSYNQGIELIYPPQHLLKLYLIKKLNTRFKDNQEVLLDISRQNISDELGISVRSVNRAVHSLKIENFLSIDRGKMQVTQSQYSALCDSIK